MKSKILKVGIVGYGSMGQQIEKLAVENDIIITDIFDIDNVLNSKKSYNFDVAIDFTEPSTVLSNIKILAKLNKNIVVGTTGWYDKMSEVTRIVKKSTIGLVYGTNFSLGMQMFLRIVKASAHMLNNADGYDIMLHELHHKRKKDSPSGTALTLAEIILNQYKLKKSLNTGRLEDAIKPDVLHISSTRGGEIAGTHTVLIDSIADTIELTHRAKNRTGFALGAIQAAKWINGKAGIYNVNEAVEDWFKA